MPKIRSNPVINCERCGNVAHKYNVTRQGEQMLYLAPYLHPSIDPALHVAVYNNVCPPCVADLDSGDYVTLDVIRFDSALQHFVKEDL